MVIDYAWDDVGSATQAHFMLENEAMEVRLEYNHLYPDKAVLTHRLTVRDDQGGKPLARLNELGLMPKKS